MENQKRLNIRKKYALIRNFITIDLLLVALNLFLRNMIEYPYEAVIIIQGIFMKLLIILYILLKLSLKKQQVVSINTSNNMRLPKDFMVKNSFVPKMLRRYRYKNYFIPESFVEFIEGHRIFLYKPLKHTEVPDRLTILDTHKFEYVLLKDGHNKKWIVHFDQLNF